MNREPAVLREQHGGLVVLRLNRPETMNALTQEIKLELGIHIPAFFKDPDGRCLMITGTGRAFCAGGDVRNMQGEQKPAEVRKRLTDSHEGWVRHLLEGEKPVVMAVNGASVGAGFALAMLGDIVLASESSYFLAGFSNVGAVADLGFAATLPRAVGALRAKEILFTRQKVTATRGEAIGLVNHVYGDAEFASQAAAFAAGLAEGPTLGIGMTKTLVSAGYDDPLASVLQTEAALQVLAFASEDRAEGAAAFVEKRKPVFKGR